MQQYTSFELQKLVTVSKLFSKIKLSPNARLVLRAMIDYYNNDTGKMYPSHSTLADVIGSSSRTAVCRALAELKKAGLIITAGQLGFTSTYFFTTLFFVSVTTIPDNSTDTNVSQFDTGGVSKTHFRVSQKRTQTNNITNNLKKDSQKIKKNVVLDKINNDRKNACSPLDLPADKAIEWYNNLPKTLYNSFFATEIRKKYNLS